jgi:hypothetical protein
MSANIDFSSFLATSHQTFRLSDTLALRVNSNANPQNTKIAALQKGLILLCNGTEVIGEGTGFGVPIVKYADETFFSGSSSLFIRKHGNTVEIRKEFLMDLVARDGFRNLRIENSRIRRLFDFISRLCQEHKRFAHGILITKGVLFKFGVKSTFIKSACKGKVIASYILDRKRILIKLSFDQLEQNNLVKVFILNEQGAHFFNTYSDSEGLILLNEEIGIWDNIGSQSANISTEQNKIGFRLKHLEGSVLRRGREMQPGSLDWIGLDYEINPNLGHFEYEIELFG